MTSFWTAKRQPLLILQFILAIALTGTVVLSPHRLIYDEPLHLEGARMLASGSSMHEMLLADLPSAPGPLYPVLHFALSPLTHFDAPSVRYVNLFLLLFSILCIAYTLRCFYPGETWLAAGMMLGIPMTWVTAGMALTEIPALAMVSFSLALVAWATREARKPWHGYAGWIMAGLFAGLAILGRQTYLPVVFAFAAVAIMETRWRPQAFIALVIACAVPLPVFTLWHGLTPPSQKHVGGGIVLEHGLLAFAYLAIVVGVIAPRYYTARWKLSLIAGMLGFALNLIATHVEWTVAMGIAKYLPNFLQQRYALICGSLLLAAMFGFFAVTAVHVWQRRTERLFLLMTMQALMLTATAFGITHLFSSRYVMTMFPFVFGMTQPFFKPAPGTLILTIFGASLGCASLLTYYWSH